MRDLNPKNPFEWLRRARGDLIIAKNFSEHEGILLEDLCFHSQQATEKALKGVLVSLGLEFPRTHSITLLLELITEINVEIPSELFEAGRLTFYAVQARYPGAYSEVEYDDYLEAVKIAEKVVDWAQEYINNK